MSATNAGTLEISLVANMARLQSDMATAQKTVGGAMANIESAVGKAKAALGLLGIGLSVGAFAGMVKSVIDAGERLHDLSIQTGATVESLSALASVGKTTGTSADAIGHAMNKLAKNMAVANEDSKGTGAAIKALGLNFDSFRKLSPDQQMKTMADAMNNFRDGSGKAAVAMTLFGKEGAKLLPFMKDLADTGHLAAKTTTEQAATADHLNDTLAMLKASNEGLKKELVYGMMPALDDLATAYLKVQQEAGGLRDKTRDLAKDGTLKDWTTSAIVGFTYLIDVAQGLANTILIVFKYFAGLFAGYATAIGSIADAWIKFQNGNFSGIGDSLKSGIAGVKVVATETANDIAALWNPELLGEKLRKGMDEAEKVRLARPPTAAKDEVKFSAPSAAAKAEASDYDKLNKSIGERIALAEDELKLGRQLDDAEKERAKLIKGMADGTLKLTDAEGKLLKAKIDMLDVDLKALALRKSREEVDKKLLEDAQKQIETTYKTRDAARDEIENYGKTADAITLVAVAKLQARQVALETNEGTEQEIATNLRLIEVLKDTASLQGQRVQLDAMKSTWESIDKTAHDAFTSIFNGGKSAFDRLRDTLKSGLLDLLYQMTVKKWLFNIAASVSGSGVASSAFGADGGSGILGAASSANSLYSAATGAYSLYGAGSALATGYSGAFVGAAAGGGATVAGAATGIGSTVGGVGGAMAGAGSVLAAVPVWGWVALAAIAAYSYFGDSKPESNTTLQFGSSRNNVTGSTATGRNQSGGNYVGGAGVNTAFGSVGVTDQFWMDAIAPVNRPGLDAFLAGVKHTDDALSAFMSAGERANVTSALDNKQVKIATGAEGTDPKAAYGEVFVSRIHAIMEALEPGLASLTDSFKGTAEQLGTESVALLQYRKSLADSSEAIFGAKVSLQQLAALKGDTETTAGAIGRLISVFQLTNAVADLFGKSAADAFGAVGLASTAARQRLVDLAGGIDQLQAGAAFFAQNMLSEGDRLAPIVERVRKSMADLGLSGVTTTEQFVEAVRGHRDASGKLVGGLDLSTEAGAQMYTKLMELAPAFKQAADYAASLTGAVSGLAPTLEGALAALATAQQNYDSAVSRANSALQTAAGQFQSFVDAVTTGTANLATARAAIAAQYTAATTADTTARKAVTAAQTAITAGYITASDKVAAIQQKISDSMGKMAVKLSDFLRTFDTTGIAGASASDQMAALQSQFAIAAARAKAGDVGAGDSLPGIGGEILKLSQSQSATLVDFQRDAAAVRNTIRSVVETLDAPAAVSPADELRAAQAEQQKWADAVKESGASMERASVDILAGFTAASVAQQTASEAVAYWASIAQSTGTDISGTADAMHALGNSLLDGFFTARFAQEKAQIELEAANKIKAGLELKQTTALENFVSAIKDVNTAAKAAQDAAAALFKAASDDLLKGSDVAKAAMLEAKDGMTYWADVVTKTAAGIAASVAAMAAAAAGIAASMAANNAAAAAAKTAADGAAAAANAKTVRDMYATDPNASAAHPTGPDAQGAAYWEDQVKKNGAAAVQPVFTGTAAAVTGTATVTGWYASNPNAYHTPDAAGVAYWSGQVASLGMDAAKAAFANSVAVVTGTTPVPISQFASGGDFAGGLRIVGENGPELEATGPSRIFNANQTAAMMNGGGDMVSELRALRDEVKALRTEARIGDQAKIQATKEGTRIWRDVTQGGTTILVTQTAVV